MQIWFGFNLGSMIYKFMEINAEDVKKKGTGGVNAPSVLLDFAISLVK